MRKTKILLIGDDTYDMYVKAFFHSFQELGYENVKLFATNHYMQAKSLIGKTIIRIESNIAFGIRVSMLNQRLIECITEMEPELVFLYSVRLIYPNIIKKIKKSGIKIFIYNNDDPFAAYFPHYFWRHFRRSLQYADVGFVYRKKNIREYQKNGCARIEMLRAYYIKSRNYYIANIDIKVPDVVFLGHNENDERQEYIRELLKAKIEVGITKQSWESFESNNPYLIKLEDSHKRYNEIMNGTKIAIVFLSKINNDTYTRRCFEIPATKTLMVAPFTDDLASMFQEDKEAVFFRSKEDFVEKIKYYLSHENERNKIAEEGYQRLLRDGHEVGDRIQFIMSIYKDMNKKM